MAPECPACKRNRRQCATNMCLEHLFATRPSFYLINEAVDNCEMHKKRGICDISSIIAYFELRTVDFHLEVYKMTTTPPKSTPNWSTWCIMISHRLTRGWLRQEKENFDKVFAKRRSGFASDFTKGSVWIGYANATAGARICVEKTYGVRVRADNGFIPIQCPLSKFYIRELDCKY